MRLSLVKMYVATFLSFWLTDEKSSILIFAEMLSILLCVSLSDCEIFLETISRLSLDLMMVSPEIRRKISERRMKISLKSVFFFMFFVILVLSVHYQLIKVIFLSLKISFDLSDDFWFFETLFINVWKSLKTLKNGVKSKIVENALFFGENVNQTRIFAWFSCFTVWFTTSYHCF